MADFWGGLNDDQRRQMLLSLGGGLLQASASRQPGALSAGLGAGAQNYMQSQGDLQDRAYKQAVLEMQRKQMEERANQPISVAPGQILLDPKTMQPTFTAPQPEMTPYQRESLRIQEQRHNLDNAGSGKPPTGYRFTPNGMTLEPIPGGPAEKLTPEQAAKATQITNATNALPDIKRLLVDQQPNPIAFYAGAGDTGKGRRLTKEAIEGYLRATSGAAVPESEVERALELYEPKPYDTYKTRLAKYERLSQFLQGTGTNMMKGRTQAVGGQAVNYKDKYGLE